MTKEQNNREEESEGKGAGNKTIELAWNELKWIKLQKGKKRKKERRGESLATVYAVWILISRFCWLTYECSNGLPCSDWRSLVYGEKTKSSNQTCMRQHTCRHTFSLSPSPWQIYKYTISTQTRATLETSQWHHEGIYKHRHYLNCTHKGILIIYLQYSTCIVGPLGGLWCA